MGLRRLFAVKLEVNFHITYKSKKKYLMHRLPITYLSFLQLSKEKHHAIYPTSSNEYGNK